MHKIARAAIVAAGMSLIAASSAWAQGQMAPAPANKPVHLRGTIEKVDGNTLTVQVRGGGTTTVKLADSPRITALETAKLSDIKEGSFIGVTAMPQPDGSQKAIGLHIFMDAQRGVVPAAFGPWDREPGSTMTNADVTPVVTGVDGQTLTVKYKDGEKKVIVPPNTPVVRFVPGTKDELKPGAKVVIRALKAPDGTISTNNVSVGRDGFTPPM